MNEERFWLLVSLKFSGEANDKELEELDSILKQHPEMGVYSEMLANLWREKQAQPLTRKKQAFESHLKRLNKHFADAEVKYEPGEEMEENFADEENMPKRRSKYRLLWWSSGIAASILLAIFLFFQWSG